MSWRPLSGFALALLAVGCARDPVSISIRISIEEPAPSVADALRRHFEPRGIAVDFASDDELEDDPDVIIQDVLDGTVDFGILEEPVRRVDGLTTVAPLYPSILHVLHRRGRSIEDFPGLVRGQRVYAGPIGGAAHRLLLQFAEDYRLASAEFTVLPDPWRVEPDVWFILGGLLPRDEQAGLADYEMYSFGDAERLGLGTQAEGLALKYPNVRPFVLPEAVYGSFTERAVLTLAKRTVLVAREDLDPNLAYLVAREVFENAHAIAAEYQLAKSEINTDFDPSTLALPLHRGARTYVDKDEPSVFERYAEVVGVGLTIVAAIGSGILAMWRTNKARRKDRIDDYYRRVLAVRHELSKKSNNYNELTDRVKAIQEDVFDQLIAERLNVDESLTVFLSLSAQVLDEIAARRAAQTEEGAEPAG